MSFFRPRASRLTQLEQKLDWVIAHMLEDSRYQQRGLKIMSQLSDAIVRLQADVDAVITKLNQPDPDVAAAVTALGGISDRLEAAAPAVHAADPGAAAPPAATAGT